MVGIEEETVGEEEEGEGTEEVEEEEGIMLAMMSTDAVTMMLRKRPKLMLATNQHDH